MVEIRDIDNSSILILDNDTLIKVIKLLQNNLECLKKENKNAIAKAQPRRSPLGVDQ
jgi:hypothetical protein